MLYTYKYTKNHDIEKLHQYIEFFFENMFNEATTTFNTVLIHKDFNKIINECKKLNSLLKKIFDAFKNLDKSSQNFIIQGFRNNNLIEKLCSGEVDPIHYKDIPDTLNYIDELFVYLYTGVLKTSAFITDHCDMKQHFIDFRELNKKYKYCPFCGLYRLNSKYDKNRDDYDHYLPKSKYPFNSINFKNLVPICSECNQGYKKTKDPLFKDNDKSKRRKVYYPYDELIDNMEFRVSIVRQGKIPIIDDKLNIEITSALGRDEEVESWDDIFEIKKRYIAEIKDNIDDWISFYFEHIYKKEKDKPGFDFNATFEAYLQDLGKFPLVDQFFLKKAALECLASEYDFEEILNKTLSA